MNSRTRPPAATEFAVLVLRSALRRRGLAAEAGELPGSVVARHNDREATVRLADHQWWRSMPGQPHVAVPVAREGAEDALARTLVSELLAGP